MSALSLMLAATALITVTAPPTAAAPPSITDIVRKALESAPKTPAPVSKSVRKAVDRTTKRASVELTPGADVAVTPLDKANSVSLVHPEGVQTLTVLHKGDSARFTVDIPDGTVIAPLGEGLEVSADGPRGRVSLAGIAAPWAVDADGDRLQTSYQLKGRLLVQTVETEDADYPITLDPYLYPKWYGAQLRFTLSETRKMAVGAGGVALVMGYTPPPYNYIIGGSASAVAFWAGWALTYDNCIAINVWVFRRALYPWYWNC